MFSHNFFRLTYVCLFLYITQSCISEPLYPPQLVLYSVGEPEYTDVLVKRVGDNLTLVCELRDDPSTLTDLVWNYIPDNGTAVRSYTLLPASGPSSNSQLFKPDLQVSDSGQYMCSSPPYSVTKYILVQTRGPQQCARGAFWCGARCVLAGYVCDGWPDCARGEDEADALCAARGCDRPHKLNCSSGRCLSAAACCRRGAALCRQPACCDEFPRHAPLEGYIEAEFPKQFEDRHAPDDFGFIQSTIYTVTACALIFMLAVVLLVSAICKMHMKRAALRQYTQPDLYRHATPRFPPCYEASRLLESGAGVGVPPEPAAPPPPPAAPPRGLARLTSIFSNRYRQVPTSDPPEVEMTSYRPPSLQSSPSRTIPDYHCPAYPDLSPDFRFLDPETEAIGRDLNTLSYVMTTDDATQPDGQGGTYMAAPVEFFRRRQMRRNTLERVFDQIDRQRMTLQLGRFQLSLPRFGRPDPRPGTPTVAEINIDDLDFVRVNSNDTYTLNGRTIRLLGGNFENYPQLSPQAEVLGGLGGNCPPSYNDAVRYKFFGPPPEYLSREGLNVTPRVDDEARSNVEMPPCYEDLASGGVGSTGNCTGNVGTGTLLDDSRNNTGSSRNGTENTDNASNSAESIIVSDTGILPENTGCITSGSTDNASTLADSTNIGACAYNNGNTATDHGTNNVTGNCGVTAFNTGKNSVTGLNTVTKETKPRNTLTPNDSNGNITDLSTGIEPVESFRSIIDNLPAIDSDVNANDAG